MAVLQRKGCLFVGKAEFLCPGPELDDICRGDSRLDDADRGVHVVAAALVGVDHRRGRAAYGEGSIITGAVTIEAVQDIEKSGITGAEHAIGVNVRMGTAAFSRDRINPFDMLRAEIVKDFAYDSDAFVFLYSRLHEAIKLVVSRIHHHSRGVEQGDFILSFDLSYLVHELLAIDDLDALRLQGKKHRDLDNIDSDGLIQELALFQFEADFLRDIFGQTGARMSCAAQGRNPGAGAFAE